MADFFLRLQGNTLEELPKAPSDLTADNISNRELVLHWINNDTSGVGEYNVIQLWDEATLRWNNVGIVNINESSFNVYNLLPNTVNKLRVAVVMETSYFPSLVYEFHTTNVAEPIPSNVQISDVTYNSAVVTWENNPIIGVGEWQNIDVYQSDGTTLVQSITGLTLTATTYTITGLTPTTTYVVKVCVRDEIIEPAPANIYYYYATLSPEFTTESIAVTDFSASLTDYDITLSWVNHDPSGATYHKYLYYRFNYGEYVPQELSLSATTAEFNFYGNYGTYLFVICASTSATPPENPWLADIYRVVTTSNISEIKDYTLDATFNTNAALFSPLDAGNYQKVASIVELNDGKYLCIGLGVTNHGSNAINGVALLNSDGTLDLSSTGMSITTIGGFYDTYIKMLKDSDGNVHVIPSNDTIRSFNGTAVLGSFKIITATMTVDTGYTGGLFASFDGEYIYAEIDNGDYLYIGSGGVNKYDKNGNVLTGFTTINGMVYVDDDALIVAKGDMTLGKYDKNTGLPLSGVTYTTNARIRSISSTIDNKYLIGRDYGSDDNYQRIIRLNNDLTIDDSYYGNNKATAGDGPRIISRRANEILFLGFQGTYDGHNCSTWLSLTADGQFNTSAATESQNTFVDAIYNNGSFIIDSNERPIQVNKHNGGIRRLRVAPLPPPPPPMLVAKWTFDSDDLTDSSGNGNDMTIYHGHGSFTYTDGIINRALVVSDESALNASAINSIINGTNSFTMTVWINSASFDDNEHFIGTLTGNYAGLYAGDNTLKYYHRDDSGDATTIQTLSADTWYHLALSFNGSESKVYVNGILKETITESDSIIADAHMYWIYTSNTIKIDDWYLYDGELSLAEIQALYNL